MVCSAVGSFERFGEHDIAFICDFCDGHIIWEDLERVPTTRANWEGQPITETGTEWQAVGTSRAGEEKQVVFAPLAVANHVVPMRGDWQARLVCWLCEDEARRAVDVDDEEGEVEVEDEFEDLRGLLEHLEWSHGGVRVVEERGSSCILM